MGSVLPESDQDSHERDWIHQLELSSARLDLTAIAPPFDFEHPISAALKLVGEPDFTDGVACASELLNHGVDVRRTRASQLKKAIYPYLLADAAQLPDRVDVKSKIQVVAVKE